MPNKHESCTCDVRIYPWSPSVILDTQFLDLLARFRPEQYSNDRGHAILDELASEQPFPVKKYGAFIVSVDRMIAGFATYRVHKFGLHPDWLYLEHLFVVPRHRRVGAGRKLLEHVIAVARERKMGLYWDTSADNEARQLYDQYASLTKSEVQYQLSFNG